MKTPPASFVWYIETYLVLVRRRERLLRALGFPSKIKESVNSVFRIMPQFEFRKTDLLLAFSYFLIESVRSDNHFDVEHGALSRYLATDDRVLPLRLDVKRGFFLCVRTLEQDSCDGSSFA